MGYPSKEPTLSHAAWDQTGYSAQQDMKAASGTPLTVPYLREQQRVPESTNTSQHTGHTNEAPRTEICLHDALKTTALYDSL